MTEAPRSNSEWQYWGKEDPLFGVLTARGRDRHGSNPWTLDEVREQGQRYFAGVRPQWQQFGMGSRHCVEIGCGTGRLTRQLVEQFERVTALDVSADQLESARALLGPATARVQFELVAAPVIPVADGSCDGVFSCEVFQHFDSDGPLVAYLTESLRVLTPGGSICFQVPVEHIPRTTTLTDRLRNTLLRVARRLGRQRMMIYRRYGAGLMLRQLESIGFGRTELRVWYSAEHGGFESFFFAEKE